MFNVQLETIQILLREIKLPLRTNYKCKTRENQCQHLSPQCDIGNFARTCANSQCDIGMSHFLSHFLPFVIQNYKLSFYFPFPQS